ncbi:amino acid adenylation domain-containing protein [Streptosporangium amethystogenes subsp. fukuiense]|uniref:Amino acid adenylation domain-containing protein n=1 Tax=Streptosporangium amethystogenes subsp. fukuiense TaxID=698418 RepID=A0ABW2SRI1_9ACTN
MRAPLSPAQERLWILQRVDPDDASYNMYLVRLLRGPLDQAALIWALTDVLARHESLRTRFTEEDGVPWAVVEAGAPGIEWLRSGSREDAERLVAERTNEPFDLEAGPPLRVAVIRMTDDRHVLCVTMHHIISDGWSLNVILDDLADCYTARLAGAEPRLRPLPVQAGDYARWQRRRAERAVPYWRERLAAPPPVELPFRREGAGSGRGEFQSVRLSPETARRLERLAAEQRTTLFTVLVAAYQTLLLRHTGQTDVLVGTVVAGRDRVELEPMVGYVSQTVILRGDLSGDPPFTDLIGRSRGEVLAALGNFSVPFEQLGHPAESLLSSMLILHNQDAGPRRAFGELTVTDIDAGFRQAKVDLLVEVWSDENGLGLSLCHDTGLFEAAEVGRLAARFALLLESVAARPDTPLSALPIWTDADRADIRTLSAGPSRSGGREPSDPRALPAGAAGSAGDILVPEMIRRAARRTPEAVAVVCGRESVTYGELLARAGALAGVLREGGVGRGDVVGVCLPRSIEAITALLAVWWAGAAYLPFDPDVPDERLAFSMADSSATHLITLREPPPGRVAVAPTTPALAGGARAPLRGETVPLDAAYVITTSGSTGVPKGVLVEHGAVAARVRWMRADYGLTSGDRVVQFASLSFDAHVEEVFPALAAGATLVLLPDGATSLPDLLASPEGEAVTVLDLPTAYWHSLAEEPGEIAWPASLRLVILGGEQVSAAAVERWRGLFGDRVRLVNTYGPTEGTVIATAADLGARDVVGRPPIGGPIAETTVRVLDDRGEPLPPGAAGELVIGGAGVARGYLGRPALTAGAFVPDPYGAPGARRYRTGDRARWRSDGRLEFLGRLDAQLKIRGFRIEPGEVESRLLAHPQVGQAFVTGRGEELVAYVTGTADPADLREHLGHSLPRQLVPTAWVSLEAFPLTPGGKIDRAALPEPVTASSAERVAPRTDAERLVAGIWDELLGAGAVGVFDDFFALGGHSLLATRVAARIRRATGIEVPIRTVFAMSTVASLAEALEELLIRELDALTDEEAMDLLAGTDHS